MKSYDPYPMTVTLKNHQSISPGEVIAEGESKFKVVEIQNAEMVEHTEMIHYPIGEPEARVTGWSFMVTLLVREIEN